MNRCDWVTEDPLYISYHDHEWGVPEYDRLKLFEMLCLEGMQAGLSWITILKRRESYREAFDHFKPELISRYDEMKVETLMQNPGIIRHRGKIEAIITNAKAFLEIEKEEPFNAFIWRFVGGKPVVHHFESLSEVPSSSPISKEMSKVLKKKGFKFVGETICYAFMQATGMVNDHLTTCDCYKKAID
ncbi:DNA-3-methyladenine glycosylase I [Terrilactibacillus sp. BCM23-1]|uniref:DNA-3-methyladenine glycosylase I n=1 Tax=Terrilactibacillus tamarindi TaxID=2599694 RepID=A0A6N8CME2_9BACI|nr:DNA-3-methyladenine glycosylase I [Terrilactibacillus tamarindi]MTT31209.1 DNA-3-methyladenine glycosylase I [Terrilactibacillus tamarindi]